MRSGLRRPLPTSCAQCGLNTKRCWDICPSSAGQKHSGHQKKKKKEEQIDLKTHWETEMVLLQVLILSCPPLIQPWSQKTPHRRQRRRAVVLSGQHQVSDTQVQVYQQVLEQLDYEVHMSTYAETSSVLRPQQGEETRQTCDNVHLFLII